MTTLHKSLSHTDYCSLRCWVTSSISGCSSALGLTSSQAGSHFTPLSYSSNCAISRLSLTGLSHCSLWWAQQKTPFHAAAVLQYDVAVVMDLQKTPVLEMLCCCVKSLLEMRLLHHCLAVCLGFQQICHSVIFKEVNVNTLDIRFCQFVPHYINFEIEDRFKPLLVYSIFSQYQNLAAFAIWCKCLGHPWKHRAIHNIDFISQQNNGMSRWQQGIKYESLWHILCTVLPNSVF